MEAQGGIERGVVVHLVLPEQLHLLSTGRQVVQQRLQGDGQVAALLHQHAVSAPGLGAVGVVDVGPPGLDVHVKDLQIGKDVTLLTDPEQMVAKVELIRAEVEEIVKKAEVEVTEAVEEKEEKGPGKEEK